MSDSSSNTSGTMLYRTVNRIAIAPADARKMVRQYNKKCPSKWSRSKRRNRVAGKITSRYARLAATSGGLTALPGTIPGIGQALAMLGGGATDTVICMKLQVDMCMCLAEAFDYDVSATDTRHLAFMIASGGALNKAGTEAATRIGSKAGVKMLQRYLRGATLQAVKQMFRKVGITFTRKSMERSLPFGIGVALGGAANYGLTRYVGSEATQWFVLDAQMN